MVVGILNGQVFSIDVRKQEIGSKQIAPVFIGRKIPNSMVLLFNCSANCIGLVRASIVVNKQLYIFVGLV